MQSRHWLPIVAILAALSLACAQESAPYEVDALLQDYQQQERAYQDAARQAGVKADLRQHPAREYLPRFKELAEKYAGQTAALSALTWILDQAAHYTVADPKADTCWVVERLTRDHAGQPEIAVTLEKVLHTAWRLEPEPVQGLYDAVLAQNPDHAVLAQATFQKAVYLAHRSEKLDDPKPVRQQALQLLREVKKTYKDTEFAKQADGWIFDLQKLQVGMKAPELVGVDLDGKAIRLSDYSGHVVVIDFWMSDGPGRDALPREKALLSMFADRPFTIIGVNGDYNRKRLESTLHENSVTWPNICDGGNGVLAKEWNVQGWPRRFVLDHHGIIRYRGNDVTRLEETARDLVKKLPPSKDKKAKKSRALGLLKVGLQTRDGHGELVRREVSAGGDAGADIGDALLHGPGRVNLPIGAQRAIRQLHAIVADGFPLADGQALLLLRRHGLGLRWGGSPRIVDKSDFAHH